MVDRYLSVKFGVNPLDGFRENDVYGRTDDGRTTDGNPTSGFAIGKTNTSYIWKTRRHRSKQGEVWGSGVKVEHIWSKRFIHILCESHNNGYVLEF